jgi:ubiquinone/menaquinone biosynthesis C-methylase UbiE
MVNNYDPLARYYDFLSRLVYGRTQVDAQVQMLDQVRPGDKLLIVGGGTGWILETLAALYPNGLQITYVEPSKVMIRLARRRKRGGHTISFVELPIEQFVTDERFDCILTGFLFDNFSQEHTEATIRALYWWQGGTGLMPISIIPPKVDRGGSGCCCIRCIG